MQANPTSAERQNWIATQAERLDLFLHAQLPDQSRARLQAQIRAGAVRVNGAEATRPGAVLRVGDLIEMQAAALAPVAPHAEAEAIPLEVLYEDDDLAVINKPAGLVVHPGAGQARGTLVSALLHRYGRLSAAGGEQRPGIVHRLDRTTSGVIVVARTDFTHQQLSAQFQARSVVKIYRALVHGLTAADGDIRLPVGRDLRQRVRMTTRRPEAHARSARTSFRRLAAFPAPQDTPAKLRAACSFSELELRLFTGRTHQIRVHLAAVGHPVVGDRLYGAAATLAGPGALAGWQPPRVMLHAAELEFTHPRSHERLHFRAPVPVEMENLRLALRSPVPDSGTQAPCRATPAGVESGRQRAAKPGARDQAMS
ncbi:MAG: RluA family pseudouridine synthase [Acidobacteria bacterium]|nr:MAG: RluA family pseudouridine synthase [Acidobacteriota bacterium]